MSTGQHALYEQRRGRRSHLYDAWIEARVGEGRYKIQWRDSSGKLHTSTVPARLVRLVPEEQPAS